MANLYLFNTFIIFYGFICNVYSSEYVPVYMWENIKNNNPVPALSRLQRDDFKDILSDKLQEKNLIVMVFKEQSLSPEDFSSYETEGSKVFPKISGITSKLQTTYYPYVEDPIEVLKEMNITIKEMSPKEMKSLKIQPGNMYFVNLNDAKENENRFQMLNHHDNIMYSIYKAADHKNILAIYTGIHSSWLSPSKGYVSSRSRRHLLAEEEEEKPEQTADNFMFINQNDIYMYFSDTPSITIGDTWNLKDCKSNEIGNFTVLCFNGTNKIKFKFNLYESGYWYMDEIEVNYENVTTNITTKINAPVGFSYHCTESVFKSENDTIQSIKLPGFQVQPFFATTNNNTFSDAYDCVGFTSAPIWSGIFVTFILAIIMSFGLCMIMDIKTMDRFDDPKGKTISINVSE